jgi:hypothetical protein
MSSTATTSTSLPDEKVYIRIYSCKDCDGLFRAAVVHMMEAKLRRSCTRDVHKYDLRVNDVKLLDYRKTNYNWCKCRSKPK